MDSNFSAFQSVPRRNAVEDVIQSFQDALINGSLQPSQRLPSEAKLGQQLGVGRGTIREAMKMLSAMGVVESRQGDGTFIRDTISPKVINPLLFAVIIEAQDIEHLYEFRRMMDIAQSELAAQKATDADFEHLEEIIREMEIYRESGERQPEKLVELDLKFHSAILESTQNPLVVKVGMMLQEMFRETVKNSISTIGGVRWTIEQHKRMLAALRTRDLMQVREAVDLGLTGSRTRQQTDEDEA